MKHRPHAPRVRLNSVAVWELLDQLGIPQNELAQRCGFSLGRLSMLMNGKRSPSLRAQRRLQEILGVDGFDLLFITEPAQDADQRPQETGAPERKIGRTEAGSAEATLTCAIRGNRPAAALAPGRRLNVRSRGTGRPRNGMSRAKPACGLLKPVTAGSGRG